MRVKLQLYATVVCLAGVALGMACKTWFAEYWFDWYPVVLIVYWTMEMVMSFFLEKNEGKMGQATLEGKKFLKRYMIAKTVKLFVTIGLIAAYITYSTDHVEEFAGCAIAFYLLNLAAETLAVTKKKK